jgi:putative transposase
MPTRLHRYDVPGHTHFLTFSCYRRLGFFWHDSIKQIAVDGLKHLQVRFRICVVGYVIMPEHVHLLLYPHPRGELRPSPVSTLLHAYKRFVAVAGKKRLQALASEQVGLWSAPLSRWLAARQPFWQTRGYDFNVDRGETLLEKLNYCHKNPLTRRLVGRAEDWPWSSYRYYEWGDDAVLAMDWDKSWPIRW